MDDGMMPGVASIGTSAAVSATVLPDLAYGIIGAAFVLLGVLYLLFKRRNKVR